MSDQVIRLKPFQYIHILDNNTNVTQVHVGPQTYTLSDHETVVKVGGQGIQNMRHIGPRQYCVIRNPVVKDTEGKIVTDKFGQCKLNHGDEEIRMGSELSEPFPLYPGEEMVGPPTDLTVVAPLHAIKLRALRNFEDEVHGKRAAGDEWLFKGPGTYYPRVEIAVPGVNDLVRAVIIKSNQALRLRAKKEFTRNNITRKTGEEWLETTKGAYLPGIEEEIVEPVKAKILSPTIAYQLKAERAFTDVYNVERKAGEQWLVTSALSEKHIPDVFEKVVGSVPITTLTSRQFCVVIDPIDEKTKKPRLGLRELRRGPASFFLNPGEKLEAGIQSVHVLDSSEALLLRAREEFMDGDVKRAPGDRWMIKGPVDYVPPVSVEIVESRRAFPLDENEGIYVRNLNDGRVRAVTGKVYMLEPYEELWSKELPNVVEDLLTKDADQSSGSRGAKSSTKRDKTKVVTYQIPHSAAVQIYDYKEKKARVVFGPDLIMLGPDEQFTVLNLSGSTPKVPKQLSVIALLLGPRFSTDVVVVETADHARLSLKLSYNWSFDVERKSDSPDAAKIFSVPDFIGDFCKAIASRVRGSVARSSFDDFHKNSADLIRTAVFGTGEDGKPKNSLRFRTNSLVVSNIDIQSVEPVDSRTRDALQKSVQLAIEITTQSQEATARHEAETLEQTARGELERQKIEDEIKAETERTTLLELQNVSLTVETAGQATAEADSRAKAKAIEGKALVVQAKQTAEAHKTLANNRLLLSQKEQDAEIEHQSALNVLEIEKAKSLASIEAGKFKSLVSAIGADTLQNIAQSGPALQQQLLSGLGLKSFMITDGSTPVNLFNTAGGAIGVPGTQ